MNKTRRRTFEAGYAPTVPRGRRAKARKRKARAQKSYSPVFFMALIATIASTLGFIGLVASVMVGS